MPKKTVEEMASTPHDLPAPEDTEPMQEMRRSDEFDDVSVPSPLAIDTERKAAVHISHSQGKSR